jgi:hypothetical protein
MVNFFFFSHLSLPTPLPLPFACLPLSPVLLLFIIFFSFLWDLFHLLFLWFSLCFYSRFLCPLCSVWFQKNLCPLCSVVFQIFLCLVCSMSFQKNLCMCVCVCFEFCVCAALEEEDKSNMTGKRETKRQNNKKSTWKRERQRGRITTRRDSPPFEPLQTNNGGRGLMSLPCVLSCTKGLLPSLGIFVLFLF